MLLPLLLLCLLTVSAVPVDTDNINPDDGVVNVGNDYVVVTRHNKLSGELACARHNLLFAAIPDAQTALHLLDALNTLNTLNTTQTMIYVKGFRGQGAPDGTCVRIDTATRQLSFVLDAVECGEGGAVLCTGERGKAVLDNTTITIVETSTVLETSTVGTTTVGFTVTETSLVTTLTTSIDLVSGISTTYTTTLPTPTTRIDTVTTLMTSTVTDSTLDTTSTILTVSIGAITATFTDTISLTEQVLLSLPLTFVQHVTELSFTCFDTAPPTTVTVTTTNPPTTITTNTCPTKTLMACPCTPKAYSNYVFINNRDIAGGQAQCACERIGAELAELSEYEVPLAVEAMAGCVGGCAAGRSAWIRTWQGSGLPAGWCWSLQADGQVLAVDCATTRSVLCRVSTCETDCFGCQFKWMSHCQRCPPYLQIDNPYAVCYNGAEDDCHVGIGIGGIGGIGRRRRGQRDFQLKDDTQQIDSNVEYSVCQNVVDNIFLISTKQQQQHSIIPLDQLCRLQGARLLNVTVRDVAAAAAVMKLCGDVDKKAMVQGFEWAVADPLVAYFSPGEAAIHFPLLADPNTNTAHILCQWPQDYPIPKGYYNQRRRLQKRADATTTETSTSTVPETSDVFVTQTVTGSTDTVTVTSAIGTSIITTTTTTFTATVTTLSSPQTTSATITELWVFTTLVDPVVTSTTYSVDVVINTQDVFTTIASTTDFIFATTRTTTDTFTIQQCQ